MEFVAIPYTDPFKIATTVVTQYQWKSVMGTEPWKGRDYVQEGDDYPAVYVSWYNAVEFCRKLSEQEGKAYRLPTEAEWEFACRGSSKTAFSFGNDEKELGKHAWHWYNCRGEQYAHRVAQKLPNQFGLYDMHGNVWEWCSDEIYKDNKVIKGGSWCLNATDARSAYRNNINPDSTYSSIGFRIVAE